jgi:cob(I)alamin adenosyltransferase
VVKINAVTTRTGDDGTTGLVDGSRLDKSDPRMDAIGDVDETNSMIGLVRIGNIADDLDRSLADIQNDLFDLGADLATPGEIEGALRIVKAQVDRLEVDMSDLLEALAPLDSFILPGGTEAAARLHLARTICRRAERKCVELDRASSLNPHALAYINRLSDFLFVAARWVNDLGRADVKWVPGANRD